MIVLFILAPISRRRETKVPLSSNVQKQKKKSVHYYSTEGTKPDINM
jgi:hypothetical protein